MFKEKDHIKDKKDSKAYKIIHIDDPESVICSYTHLQDKDNKQRTLIIRTRDLTEGNYKLIRRGRA